MVDDCGMYGLLENKIDMLKAERDNLRVEIDKLRRTPPDIAGLLELVRREQR